MSDQASQLRLRMQTVAQMAPGGDAPNLVVVWGALPGVGATTIAVNLAVELARHGRRIALLGINAANEQRSNLCGPSPTSGRALAEVLAGRGNLCDALRDGPQGLMVADANIDERTSLESLITAARTLHGFQWVLLDAGIGISGAGQQLAAAADEVLAVTTAADASIMQTYAAIKLLVARRASAHETDVRVIVNRAANADEATDAAGRLAHGCRRFLALPVETLGHVPEDSAVAGAQTCAAAVVSLSPRAPAARALRNCAEAWRQRRSRPEPQAQVANGGLVYSSEPHGEYAQSRACASD